MGETKTASRLEAPRPGRAGVPGLVAYRFDAPIFFANADAFREDLLRLVREASMPVTEVVVIAEAITDIDTTGVNMFRRLLDDLEESGVLLSMARVRTSVREVLSGAGIEERIGSERFCLTVVEAANAFGRRTGREIIPGGDA